MNLSPDNLIYWQAGFFKLNATIVFTWALMLLLTQAGSWTAPPLLALGALAALGLVALMLREATLLQARLILIGLGAVFVFGIIWLEAKFKQVTPDVGSSQPMA